MSEEEIISQRIEKIKELEKNSIEPYAYSFDKNDQASEILDKYKELKNEEKTNEIASVAGRITRIRIMGTIKRRMMAVIDAGNATGLYFFMPNTQPRLDMINEPALAPTNQK